MSTTEAPARGVEDPVSDAGSHSGVEADNGNSLTAALLEERLRLYEANRWLVLASHLVAAVLTTAVLWPVNDAARLFGWLALLGVALALRLSVDARLRRAIGARPPTPAVQLRLERVTTLGTGLAWGLAAVALLPAGDARLQVFLAFMLAGMAAGSLTLTAFDLTAAIGFATLTLAPLVMRLLADAEAANAAMASMLLLFVAFMALTGQRGQRAFVDNVAARTREAQRIELMLRDRERRQQLADALAEKTDALQVTLDSMDQGILSLGPDGRTNFYNNRLSALIDLPAEFLAGRPTMEQIARYQLEHGHYGDELDNFDEPSRRVLERWLNGENVQFPPVYVRRKPDGTMLEVKSRYLADGTLVRTFADVTAYFDALRRLEDSQAETRKLALVAAHTDNAVAVIDAQQRVEWINEGLTRLTGYTPEELIGRRTADLLRGPRTDPAEFAGIAAQLQRDRHWSGEYLQHTKDGRPCWFAVDVKAIVDPQAKVLQYIAIARDVSARRAADQALQVARDEAERASRAKSDFLSAMSHELRTPMNAILGFTQLLHRHAGQRLTEEERGHLEQILLAGSHLLDLINDVLDLARVEAGRLSMQIEPVRSLPLIEECLALLAPLAVERGVTVAMFDPAACDAWVAADRTRLRQVLINLLSNGIKYNRRGGTVRIACEDRGKSLRLSVIDDGPGISAEQRTRLFTAFERLGAEQGPVPGAGIGLALSRQLVEHMGGSIGVDSEPGRGTTVWLDLHRALAPSPGAVTFTEPPEPAAPHGKPEASAQRTVLYIEDNPVNLMLMEALLAREPGVRLISAEVPETGLTLARDEQPDLVLLDIQLPGMSGFDVLRHLRGDSTTGTIPVVAVSANAMPADIDRALAAGFDAYLTKPVDHSELLAVIRRRWRTSAAEPRGTNPS